MEKHRIVIVGAGFAGLSAAKGFRGSNEVAVTLIDRRNHHLFQPLLYQVAMAGLSPAVTHKSHSDFYGLCVVL